MTDQILSNISLEMLCREQGEPFTQLSPGDPVKVRILCSIREASDVPYRSTAMYCGRVKDVVVFGKSYVTDRAGRGVFFGQSHRDYERADFLDLYKSQIMKEQGVRPLIEQECCFLGGWPNFGHFLFEYLYRLVAFDMVGALDRLPVVVFDDMPEAWLSFIELYGVPKGRILRIPRLPAPQFNSVWIAGCPNALSQKHEYTFWDDGIQRLRDRLRENAAEVHGGRGGPKKIFFGRKGTSHRRLLNEDEAGQYLSSRGFESPDIAGLSAADQIQIVASAEIIVLVSGAGSPITCFAPDTCSIIEIRPPSISGVLGSKGFAAVVGQTFTPLEGRVVSPDAERSFMDQDIEISMDLLRSHVDLALNKQELLANVARHSAARAAKK